MNGDLLAALDYFEREKGIDRKTLLEAIETAVLSAAKKSVGPARDLRVEIDRKTGAMRCLAKLKVVERVAAPHDEISITRAQGIKPDAQLGEDVDVEVTPAGFGRIAAQTAKQAMTQRIRAFEKERIFDEFKDRVGDILNGTVRRFERSDVIVDVGKAEALMPHKERVPTEEYMAGDRVRALLLEIQPTAHGPELILSRSHPDFVIRLLELEVNEIKTGQVKIQAIAREAGYRTKLAVMSLNDKVEPVGACVGMKGVRIKNIVRELNNEKIDIIRWDKDAKAFVVAALSPAKMRSIEVDEASQTVKVLVDEDQLSLAIGKRGQNVRLASKLTGWKIDIQKIETVVQETFEGKVKGAVDALAAVEGIGPEVADKLVHGGLLTIQDVLGAETADIAELLGVEEEQARAIHEAVAAARENASHPASPAGA
ncbi:MAG: transcription termination factor NusA [Verrucomicrobia bacterium]|nr:transcription termination factor NusA [Verrucomicrobiota bacterium]